MIVEDEAYAVYAEDRTAEVEVWATGMAGSPDVSAKDKVAGGTVIGLAQPPSQSETRGSLVVEKSVGAKYPCKDWVHHTHSVSVEG